ncbi:MAG: hypothetical protein AAGN15_23325 [Cyanobacteria bacterium J06581_3]
MNGSRPNPPPPRARRPKPPKPPKASGKRRRPSTVPVLSLGILFMVYLAMGLLMSVPSPPYWVWIAVAIAIPLLTLGVNRPIVIAGKRDWGGLLAYPGGLVMVVALAVCANYIASENSFEDVRFFTAIAGLAGLCLLAVLLSAIAAITSASAGTRLMNRSSYGRSVTTVLLISFLGLFVGGLMGLFVLTLGVVTA